MSCPICGGTMVGDGHTTLRHCEFARDEDIEGKEPDAGPVYCVEIVREPDWQVVTVLPHGYIEVDCNSGNHRTPAVTHGANRRKHDKETETVDETAARRCVHGLVGT